MMCRLDCFALFIALELGELSVNIKSHRIAFKKYNKKLNQPRDVYMLASACIGVKFRLHRREKIQTFRYVTPW